MEWKTEYARTGGLGKQKVRQQQRDITRCEEVLLPTNGMDAPPSQTINDKGLLSHMRDHLLSNFVMSLAQQSKTGDKHMEDGHNLSVWCVFFLPMANVVYNMNNVGSSAVRLKHGGAKRYCMMP